MEKIFKNAKECAEFLIKTADIRKYPKFLEKVYYGSPIEYLFKDMYNKYVRGKNPFARCCEEFNNAEKNAIEFIEQTLITNGFNLSILYNCECVNGDGYFSYFKVELENIPQQLELF